MMTRIEMDYMNSVVAISKTLRKPRNEFIRIGDTLININYITRINLHQSPRTTKIFMNNGDLFEINAEEEKELIKCLKVLNDENC
jgi:hypothetical protein